MGRTLAGTVAATAAAAVSGSLAGRRGVQDWFTTIRKPRYVPPDAVFPIAWTALYTDIAVTSAAVIDRLRADGRVGRARSYTAALGVNLALNGAWSWVFFGRRKLGPAVVVAAALAASSADLARRARQADPVLGAALVPYPLWCSFATVMSGDIWRLNRR